jgi:hypothetical protein
MNERIRKYFRDINDGDNCRLPATDEQILQLENQLQLTLPGDYKEFLQQMNGYEGSINEFIVDFVSVEEIYQSTKDTCMLHYPWAVYIGTDGGLEMFVIDTRQTPFQFGLLPNIGNDNDFIALGDTFEKFIERLYQDRAFDTI